MKIYLLFIDDIKYKQYSKMRDALLYINNLIKEDSKLKIQIFVDNYDEYGHSDACCKRELLYEFINNKVEKFIDYE